MKSAWRCAFLLAAMMAASAWSHPHYHNPSPGEEGAPFDYFILALSWSPTYCASHAGETDECRLGRGFVAHGLWPQYINGGGPEHCETAEAPDRRTIERTLSAMPDERLIHHEWLTHGSCSAMSAHDYFLSLIKAVGALTIPEDFDGRKTRHLSASQISGEFQRANPSLSERSMVLRCKAEQFEELRICLSPDLQPVPCGRGVHSQCRQGSLLIRAAPAPERSSGR